MLVDSRRPASLSLLPVSNIFSVSRSPSKLNAEGAETAEGHNSSTIRTDDDHAEPAKLAETFAFGC